MVKKWRGVTLVELVVVMAIVGILAAMVFPTYTRYLQRARRSDGQGALLDLAGRMERFYTQNNSYANATIGTNPATDVLANAISPEGWYTLTINSNATSYTLTAAPLNAQNADTLCASLTYNNLGIKNQTGTGTRAQCW